MNIRTFLQSFCILCTLSAAAATKHNVSVRLVGEVGETKEIPVKQYEAGKKVTVSVAPDKNRCVTQWRLGSETYAGFGKSFTFNMPDEDVSLTARLNWNYADWAELHDAEPKLMLWSGSTAGASKDKDGFVTSRVGRYVRTIYYAPTTKLSKLTAKFDGLPKGLKVTPTNHFEVVGLRGEVNFYPAWEIAGVPTEAMNLTNAPAIVSFSCESKTPIPFTLPLEIVADTVNASFTQGVTVSNWMPSLPKAEDAATAWLPKSGIPAGLKADKLTGALYGTPTKAGQTELVYARTRTVGKTKYTETYAVNVRVGSPSADRALFGNVPSTFASTVATSEKKSFATWFLNVDPAKMTGLPPGLSFDARTLEVKGTPTKAGTYPVTLSGKSSKTGTTASCTIFWTVRAPTASVSICDAFDFGDNAFRAYAGQEVEHDFTERQQFVFALPGSKVSASGLPSGLKLVKVGQEMLGANVLYDAYRIVGVPTAAKLSTVTVKISYNGLTDTHRFAYEVRPFRGAGTLYGRFEPPWGTGLRGPLVAGELSLTIAANGSAKAVLSDGKDKLTVSFKGYAGNPPPTYYSPESSRDYIKYHADLPATKTMPARTIVFQLAGDQYFNELTGNYDVIYATSQDTSEILCEDDWRYERTLFAGSVWQPAWDYLPDFDGRCPHEPDFTTGNHVTSAFFANNASNTRTTGGYVTLARDKGVETKAKVSGRTPDGFVFANKPVTYCWNEDVGTKGFYWTPFAVYNKATGNTWVYTCETRGTRVNLANAETGEFVDDCYNFANKGPQAGTYKACVGHFASGYATFPDAVARIVLPQDSKKNGLFSATFTIYADGKKSTLTRTLGAGVKGADLSVDYKPATLLTTFKDDGWDYELLPCTATAGIFYGTRTKKVGTTVVCQPVTAKVN